MFRKILLGIILAAFLGLSYQQYYQVNVYGIPRKIEKYQRHYNQILGETWLPKRLYDPEIQIMKPTAEKLHVKGYHAQTLRVTVPYRFSSRFPDIKGHQINYSNNFGENIRISAGGALWQSKRRSQTAKIDLKHRSTTGKVTFDLPISDGYPEKVMRNYQVYFLNYPNVVKTDVVLYKIN